MNQRLVITDIYDPLKAGSIDGTDTEPHDRAVVRALTAKYKPNLSVDGDPNKTIFVSNINRQTDEDTLWTAFRQFGKIEKCRLVRDIVTGFSKGYGFIEYEEKEDASLAQRRGYKLVVDDSALFVDFECERTTIGWVPRRFGGGYGGNKKAGQLRFGGRERPFFKPIYVPGKSHAEELDDKEDDRDYKRDSKSERKEQYWRESHDRRTNRRDRRNRSDSRDRNRNRRDRSHSKERYRDRSRSKERYRDRSRSKERYRDRSRSKERYRDRSRSKERYEYRNRSRSREKYRGRSRSREKDQERVRKYGSDKSQEREKRERCRSRDKYDCRGKRRDDRRHKSREKYSDRNYQEYQNSLDNQLKYDSESRQINSIYEKKSNRSSELDNLIDNNFYVANNIKVEPAVEGCEQSAFCSKNPY